MNGSLNALIPAGKAPGTRKPPDKQAAHPYHPVYPAVSGTGGVFAPSITPKIQDHSPLGGCTPLLLNNLHSLHKRKKSIFIVKMNRNKGSFLVETTY